MVDVDALVSVTWEHIRPLIEEGLSFEEVLAHCASQSETLRQFLLDPSRDGLTIEQDLIRRDKWQRESHALSFFYFSHVLCLVKWRDQGLINVESVYYVSMLNMTTALQETYWSWDALFATKTI